MSYGMQQFLQLQENVAKHVPTIPLYKSVKSLLWNGLNISHIRSESALTCYDIPRKLICSIVEQNAFDKLAYLCQKDDTFFGMCVEQIEFPSLWYTIPACIGVTALVAGFAYVAYDAGKLLYTFAFPASIPQRRAST